MPRAGGGFDVAASARTAPPFGGAMLMDLAACRVTSRHAK
ncbi:protein of unassigned function [Methylobacterium oryzae CBMB20]|uniref:Protein of unassigned function n=1 Tax=Methylobacterium oryzae CBMB20 TaxID=693986 RepID=A0A089NQK7_9HYPH|nr:protein of unassigned function [Methylobacterium oryzae CBMB20]